ncbi:MAG: Gfo/Idh/MocA family protein [Sedimentisphaeraceae bacterium JB056]
MPDMQTKTIDVAVIGLGKMGSYHVAALNQLISGAVEDYYKGNCEEILPKIRLCAVCDSFEMVTGEFAGVPFFNDYRDVIDDLSPNIVVVATPTATHFAIAEYALERGVNVFVEKPIVVRLDEFETLVSKAEANGVNIMAGHIERYNPVSIKIKELLDNWRTSKVTYLFNRLQMHSPRIEDDIIVDKLIHDLDLALFYFGDILQCDIVEKIMKDGKVQQLRLKTLHQNCSGEIFVSWLAGNDTSRNVRIDADDYVVEGDFLQKQLCVDSKKIECKVDGWIKETNNQVKDELFDFIMYCFGDRVGISPPLLSLKQIRESVAFIEGIHNEAYGG